MNTLGTRIKEVRKELKLTQKEFGKRVGISHAHVSNIEAGNDFPSDSLLLLICFEYKINEEWLRYGTGAKSSDYSKVVKGAMEDESLDLSKSEVSQEYIKLFATQYSKLIDMLGPGGALPGRLPFKDEPELIDIINYLQHQFIEAKDMTDKLRIAVKFEYAFPDYKSVIEVLNRDYLAKREQIREEVRKYGFPNIELSGDEEAATSEFNDMSDIRELGRKDALNQFKTMLEELKDDTSVLVRAGTNTQSQIKQRSGRINRNQIIYIPQGTGKTSTTLSNLYKYLNFYESRLNAVAEEPAAYVPNLGKVAAGPPIDLIEDNTGLNPVFGSKDVDFTLQISGDSMEPDFPDGSYVFVKKEAILENGEIGIVMINDQVVCKKFYHVNGTIELRSINNKYDPIVLTSGDVRILGKVVKY